MIRIPPPEFLIFYNGKEELPERTVLKLSDMYEKEDPHAGLELEAVMLNISGKNNRKLKRCLQDTQGLRNLYGQSPGIRGRDGTCGCSGAGDPGVYRKRMC